LPSVELFSWERSVELEFALPAAHLPVACDRQRVLQVLSNFLGNAIKFTPEGGRVLLRVERRGDEADFSVRDTGPGIPADQLPHVFERFWRADRKSQRSSGLACSSPGRWSRHTAAESGPSRRWDGQHVLLRASLAAGSITHAGGSLDAR
jgi:hypothetical protein